MVFKQYLENDDREGPEGVEGKGEGPEILNGQQQNTKPKISFLQIKSVKRSHCVITKMLLLTQRTLPSDAAARLILKDVSPVIRSFC